MQQCYAALQYGALWRQNKDFGRRRSDPWDRRHAGRHDLPTVTDCADIEALNGRSLMLLTLADANRVIAGAIAKAEAQGAKMNIAVCDAGGRLVAFQRMDGAMWAGSYGSQGKAVASAAFGRPSGDLTARAEHPTLRGSSWLRATTCSWVKARCQYFAAAC